MALFKYQKYKGRDYEIEGERERGNIEEACPLLGDGSAAFFLVCVFYHNAVWEERQSFHKWWTIPGKRPGPTSFLLFGRLYGPRDQRGNMGKRQPPLYLPVYLHCLSDCLYSPPSSLCLILQFSLARQWENIYKRVPFIRYLRSPISPNRIESIKCQIKGLMTRL